MVFNFFNRWAALLKSISARNAWARSPQLLRPTRSTEFSGSSTIFSPPTGFPSRINASLRCSWDVWIISLLVEPSSYLMFVQIKDCSFWNDASVLLSRLLALTVRYFYRAISIGDLQAWAEFSQQPFFGEIHSAKLLFSHRRNHLNLIPQIPHKKQNLRHFAVMSSICKIWP